MTRNTGIVAFKLNNSCSMGIVCLSVIGSGILEAKIPAPFASIEKEGGFVKIWSCVVLQGGSILQ